MQGLRKCKSMNLFKSKLDCLLPSFFHSSLQSRGSHLEWTATLCISSVPALWNSSPTAHHNDAILHSPKQPFCSALHSKMSVQKEGTSKWQGREWNIRVHCVIANSGAEKNDPSAPTYCWERQKVSRSTVGHPITRTKVHTVSWKLPDHSIQT